MFIAARRIQSFWRAHRDRKLRDKRWQACVTIQRSWRCFRLRRQLWDLLEQRLQKEYLDYLNLMATRIQSLFRGWYDRRHIHNMLRLTRIQVAANEELLCSLIESLRHLKRIEYLPGVYSMRETDCISKVENILTTMTFRFHNGRLTSMVSSKKAWLEEARRHFRDCRFYTDIPYSGDFSALCGYHSYKNDSDVGNELLDLRMHDVATQYESLQRCEYLKDLHSNSLSRKYSVFTSVEIVFFFCIFIFCLIYFFSEKRNECLHNITDRERTAREQFCNSVISSMRRWAAWKEFNVGLTEFLGSTEKRERFFKRMSMVFKDFEVNCDCVTHVFPVYHCPQAHEG
ncbi:hypothetical protein KR038_005971 [Drosophila bunnanda]|nr:hypothetical protein KR038_005971 [Drosophila bunnanda]